MALGGHVGDLAFQCVEVGEGRRGEPLQRNRAQQPLALRGTEQAQKKFARGRAVRWHARSGVQVKAQRCGGLHAVQVQHLAARKAGQVAALAQGVHQLTQDRVAGALGGAVEHQLLGQQAQAVATAIVPTVALPLQQPGGLQLLQHAVHGRFGQPHFLHDGLLRERLVTLCNHFQQRKQTQGRRVPCAPRSSLFVCFFHAGHLIHL